jgi:hypothetical protein
MAIDECGGDREKRHSERHKDDEEEITIARGREWGTMAEALSPNNDGGSQRALCPT